MVAKHKPDIIVPEIEAIRTERLYHLDQLLVSFDMEKVKAAGYDVTTPLIVTNSDDYKDMKILSEDSVTPSDKVLEIVK